MRCLVVLLAATPVIAGCSSSSSSSGVTCGAGTTQVGGQCIAAQDGSTMDSAVATDASDGSTTQDSAAGDGASTTDAAGDAPAETGEPASDPCPDPNSQVLLLAFDCDKTCCATPGSCSANLNDAGVDPVCPMATCGISPFQIMFDPGQAFVIRTPDAPGTDPSCVSACPADGYVYGLGLDSTAGGNYWLQVAVGSPWEIITNSGAPYCTDSTSKVSTNCVSFATAQVVSPTFYVMTKDPNAPARNIIITSSSTQIPCPADGGI